MCNQDYRRDSICKSLYTNIVSLSAIILCACCFGMLVIALVIGLYYTCLFPTLPATSLESPGMYDYADDYNEWRLKKDVHSQEWEEEDTFVEDYQTTHEKGIFRLKRDNVTTSSPIEVTKAENVTVTMAAGTDTFSSSAIKTNASSGGLNTKSTAATAFTTETVDSSISNRFIDSVFTFATNANMKDPLGLCRTNLNVKMRNVNNTLFPPEGAEDIITCINHILKDLTVSDLCVQLDDEMDAYLKWLVLTGEPRHKPHKPPIGEDFLFPNSCAAPDGDTKQPNQGKPDGDSKLPTTPSC